MDIDFSTTLGTDFVLSIDGGGQVVTGNRALLNRFELTFLTSPMSFTWNGVSESDGFGGDAMSTIGSPRVLNDTQAIAASVQAAVNATVTSLESDQAGLPATEQIGSAAITSLDVVSGVVVAGITVVPVETQAWSVLSLNLPITNFVG